MKRTVWILISKNIWTCLLLLSIALAGCGTFDVQVEPAASPQPATVEPFLTPTLMPGTLSPTAKPTVTQSADAVVTEEADLPEDSFTITGRAMAIDPPTGIVVLIPETETPFAGSNGEVIVRISEWAHIVDSEGTIVNIGDFSRGIKLELKLSFHEGELTSEEVIVLERGVPLAEENPAYTDVTGKLTPLAEPPSTGDGAIQLFQVDGPDGAVDPGSPITLDWAFSSESGSICVDQVPRPVTPTCYPDLPPSGSTTVTVPVDAREAVIYTLYVHTDDKVESADIRVPISEGLGCQYEWYFEHEYLLGCPAREAITVQPQAQNFEKGLMLRVEGSWLGPAPYIFAFVWDEEHNEYGFSEGPLFDTWTQELSEQVIGEEPPEGLFRPSRSFGLLWSGQIEIPQMGEPRTMDGSNLLGWAKEPVYEYDAQYQCAEEFFGNQNCYISLPGGQIVGLPGQVR